MIKNLRLLLLSVLASLPAQARVLLNEVHIDPPGPGDESHQYVEIISVNDANNQPEAQTLGNLSVLFVDSNGNSVGGITETLNLNGLQTGSNGLLLIGIGYDQSIPWTIDDATNTADFAKIKGGGVGAGGDIGPKAGMTVLLVAGFTGKPTDDLDTNENGTLTRTPWSNLLDSVSYGDKPYRTALPITISPGNVSRNAVNSEPNAAAAWYGGNILNTEGLLSLTYEDPFGPFTGSATPGTPNQAPPSENPIRINEVLVNPAGQDADNEFIELLSTSGGITSTDGLWLLVLDSNSDGGVVGEVLEAWDLSGQSTGINGLMVVGNNYTPSSNPWKDVISKDTTVFEPAGMGDEDIRANEGFSLLLVKGFTGKAQDALGDGDDLDTNDDGTLDTLPWDQSGGTNGILDSVGFSELQLADLSVVRETFALADATPPGADPFHPDSLFRKPGDMAANSSSAWQGGNIGGDSSTGIAYRPNRFFGDFRGQVTPGLPNLAEAPAQTLILINEVHLDPVAALDLNLEYIELISPSRTFTPLQDLSLLIVDVDGAAKGEIRNVLDLRGLSTGSNGLMLIGDSYNDLNPYTKAVRTHDEDPPGLTIGEIGPDNNNSLAILLVEGFTGVAGNDIDADDDGVFDATPWASVMDAVGFGAEFKQTENIANLNNAGFIPDTISRLPSDLTPNSAASWYGGTLAGVEDKSVLYDQSFGPFKGQATPGRFNTAGPVLTSSLLINEVHINPPGNDDNFEYIEILSTSGSRQSTHDHTLVMIENAGANGGEILEFWNLDGMSTGTNGLLLLGNGYSPGTLAYWDRSLLPGLTPEVPFASVNTAVTAVGDPLDLGNDNIGPNNSFTLLLVEGFRGTVGRDLDMAEPVGALDTPLPWTVVASVDGILDSLAILDYDNVAMLFDGHAYVGAQLGQQTFQPDNVSRKVGNTNANDVSAWFGGDIAAGLPATGLVFGADFFGLQTAATPGAPNGETDLPPEGDEDGDGATNAEEALAGTDPTDASDYLHVTSAVRDAAGNMLTWTSVSGKSYAVEYSVTLEIDSWQVISEAPVPAEGLTTAFTDTDAARTSAPAGFYRARVSN